jgi:hypothetical protein
MTALRLVANRPAIQPPDYFVRALLNRDGFVERFGSPLGRAPLEMDLPRAPGLVARWSAALRAAIRKGWV